MFIRAFACRVNCESLPRRPAPDSIDVYVAPELLQSQSTCGLSLYGVRPVTQGKSSYLSP